MKKFFPPDALFNLVRVAITSSMLNTEGLSASKAFLFILFPGLYGAFHAALLATFFSASN